MSRCPECGSKECCGGKLSETIEELQHHIEGLCKPKWISVKDRLPESGILVLVYEPSFAMTDLHDEAYWPSSVKRQRGVRFGYIRQGSLTFAPEGCNGDGYNITHWMPLPEPPDDK